MIFAINTPCIKVKHKYLQKTSTITHILEKDHGVRKGDLFITKKRIRVNEISTEPTKDNVIHVSDVKFAISLDYLTEPISKNSCLLFLGVVFIPSENIHYLRFLYGSKIMLFSFIKGVTFKNLRKNFTIINND